MNKMSSNFILMSYKMSNNLSSVYFSFLSRLINPVVVAPTIAAVGLSFYSYGFPRVGTCLEIGVVQILLVIIFSLVSSEATFISFALQVFFFLMQYHHLPIAAQ